ncbi:MAG: kelch repeat-containing protein, partial [Acidobacteriota bacterium]
ARVGHTATLLPNGKILIVGGWSNGDAPESSAEIYNPNTETFTPIGDAHNRLSGHIATLLDNGKVLIAGGSDGKHGLNDAELFDSKTEKFSTIEKMQTARIGAAATKLADGQILLTGGAANRGEILSSAEIYNPATNKFTTTDSMNVVRYKHDSVLLADGRVLVFGGSDNRDWNGQHKTAEIFDPKTNKFTPTNDMNVARFKVEGGAVLLKNGKVFIGGGGEIAEIFDPNTNTFTKTAGEFGAPLHYASVTLLDDERALIVGGYGNGTRETGPISTNQAWIFKI